MLVEIERLGESPEHIEWIAREHGSDFAQFFLKGLTDTSKLFDKWFPRLKAFESEKRAANPFLSDEQLSSRDLMARRILEPKIVNAERVPQRGKHCAAIFHAPLAVLPLVTKHWPSEYSNSVFLTHEELREWEENYIEAEEVHWWYCFQDWNVEFDPPEDSFWFEFSDYVIPEGASSAIATWGLSWESLAGGMKAELWCIENGTERLMGNLGDVTF